MKRCVVFVVMLTLVGCLGPRNHCEISRLASASVKHLSLIYRCPTVYVCRPVVGGKFDARDIPLELKYVLAQISSEGGRGTPAAATFRSVDLTCIEFDGRRVDTAPVDSELREYPYCEIRDIFISDDYILIGVSVVWAPLCGNINWVLLYFDRDGALRKIGEIGVGGI